MDYSLPIMLVQILCLVQVARGAKVDAKQWSALNAGCHGTSLIYQYLPYVDYNLVHIVPVAHAMLHGLIKDFWKLLLSKKEAGAAPSEYALPSENRKVMAARGRCLVLTNDFGRPYRCVVNERGYWVMEDWVNWTEVASIVILQPFTKVSECTHQSPRAVMGML